MGDELKRESPVSWYRGVIDVTSCARCRGPSVHFENEGRSVWAVGGGGGEGGSWLMFLFSFLKSGGPEDRDGRRPWKSRRSISESGGGPPTCPGNGVSEGGGGKGVFNEVVSEGGGGSLFFPKRWGVGGGGDEVYIPLSCARTCG